MKPSDRSPRARGHGWLLLALGTGLTLALPRASAAESDLEPVEPAWLQRLNAEEPADPRPPDWLGENVFYKKGVGLEYRHELKLGDRALELGFGGPVVRKKKRLGVTFELRF